MSPHDTTWVGMDAHKNSIKVAALLPGQAEPGKWTEEHEPEGRQHLNGDYGRCRVGSTRISTRPTPRSSLGGDYRPTRSVRP